MAKRRVTILEAAVRRVGVLQGSRAVAVMVQWHTVRAAMGDEWPADGTVSDRVRVCADWWHVTERTAWNELRRFRAAFPGEETPERLMTAAQASWDERRGVAGLGSAPLPA